MVALVSRPTVSSRSRSNFWPTLVPRMTIRQAECGSACGRTPSVSGTVLLRGGAVVVIPTCMRVWGGSRIILRVRAETALRTSIRATEQHPLAMPGAAARGSRSWRRGPVLPSAAAMSEDRFEATELAGDRLELASTGVSGPSEAADQTDEDAPASNAGDTPERIGRYLVLRKLGAGAMGMVVVGYDPELDRKLAIKLIHPRVARRGEARSRMLREAKGLARLSHPNVVQVYDAGAVDGRVFIAMELVDGQPLSAW